MKNTFGNNITLTLFGESHGPAIGAVLDGLAPGIEIDEGYISLKMEQRSGLPLLSTSRREPDKVRLISGVFNGKTTGTPLCILIENKDVKSGDYTYGPARPGHADFAAFMKYHGYEDYRGGGHFSGRLTAPFTAAGAILLKALKNKGILIGTHIKKCAGIFDRAFDDYAADIEYLDCAVFPCLKETAGEDIKNAVRKAAESHDSVGGILETAVTGLDAGLGEPWFDSLESCLSHAVFSVPAVKGIEFGKGFELADMTGSAANDPIRFQGGSVVSLTNNNGGINGGISNGMPLLFCTAIKPTPSISKPQQSVDFIKGENTDIKIKGRHDPAIVHRAAPVLSCAAALVICDLLCARYGTDYLK